MDHLTNHLAHGYPEFWRLLTSIDDYQSVVFGSKKLQSGFTLLIPYKDYVEHLVNLKNKDEEEVIDHLKNLILPIQLKSIGDFNFHKDDIPNMHNKRLVINKIEGNAVFLGKKGVVKLQQDKRFEPNKGISCFVVSGEGAVPKGTKTSHYTRVKKASDDKMKHIPTDNKRESLYTSVIQSSRIYETSLQCVASFVRWLKQNEINIYYGILPFLDHCPVTSFLILFEPFKGGYYFIDDMIINKWHCNRTVYKNPAKVFKTELSTVLNCATHTKNFASVLDDVRSDLGEISTPKSLIKGLESVYRMLIETNKIEDLSNIMPDEAFNYLKSKCTSNYNLKLFQDEVRVMVSSMRENGDSFKSVLMEFREKSKFLPQYNNIRLCDMMSKTQIAGEIRAFAQSSYLLYMCPLRKGEFGGRPGKYSDIDPEDDTVTDMASAKIDELDKYISSSQHISSDEVFESVEALLKSGEKFPAELYRKLREHHAE